MWDGCPLCCCGPTYPLWFWHAGRLRQEVDPRPQSSRAKALRSGFYGPPPVELITSPVIHAASSETNHSISRAVSSGCPHRPCGSCFSTS